MAWGNDRNTKRRFGSGKGAPHPKPRRGPPAIFLTCESGRERKAQREALDLIHHYYYLSRPTTTPKEVQNKETPSSTKSESPDEQQPLSLEEELAMLRKGAAAEEVLSYEPNSKRPRTASTNVSSKQISSMKSPFSIYDVGVRGMVCIICTLPGCEMVPYDEILAEIRAKKEAADESKKDDSNKSEEKDNVAVEKDPNNGKTTEEEVDKRSDPPDDTNDPRDTLWDAVETVRCIMRDATCAPKVGDGANNEIITNGKKDIGQEEGGEKEATVSKERLANPPPGSRFISRILPMQATCYASVDEIKAVSISLLKQCLPKFEAILSKTGKEVTFKLEIKRRLCSHLTREQVIESVTPVVMGGLEEMPGYKFSVNLSDPDFSIRIETCKSLCGVSILPREAWYKNFNLAELTHPTDRTEESAKVSKPNSHYCPAPEEPSVV